MRFGKNPYKSAEAYIPKKITTAMLTYIPNLSGYFEHRFDILKLSINSLMTNTAGNFDFLVFDNGSCEEVKNYLINLQKRGLINFLIFSNENLGVLGAYNMIFKAAPGELVAYSDDDIFFLPGWLEESIKVINTFPNVGMVSSIPTWHNFSEYETAADELLENNTEIKTEISYGWPDGWKKEYCESIGWDLEGYNQKNKDVPVRKILLDGASAFTTSTHCQFVVSRKAIESVFPLEVDGSAMKNVAKFDELLNQKKYLRLSLQEPYVFHIGNQISPEIIEYANKFKITTDVRINTYNEVNNETILIKIIKNKYISRIIKRFYSILFKLVSISEGKSGMHFRKS